jgi:ATP-dependent helicase HrpB
MQEATLLVAAEVSEIEGRGGEVNVLLALATAVRSLVAGALSRTTTRDGTGVVYDRARGG